MSTKQQIIELLTAEINWQTFLLKNLSDDHETEQKITAKIERLTKLLADVDNTDFTART
jgi:hypothetical protein